MLKPFRFIGKVKRIVYADSLQAARNYVGYKALTCHAYRSLAYVGMGYPSRTDGWIASVAHTGDSPARYRRPAMELTA